MEDDIVVDDMPHWTETIQDVVAEAPPDWGILQLWTNNPAFYKYIHQGQSGDQVDTASMGNMSVDPASPVCADGRYNRPAFVPWYDDVWPAQPDDALKQPSTMLPPTHGGLWSTMAYLINRKGMNSIITKLGVGPNKLGNLSLPVLADHLVFQVGPAPEP